MMAGTQTVGRTVVRCANDGGGSTALHVRDGKGGCGISVSVEGRPREMEGAFDFWSCTIAA